MAPSETNSRRPVLPSGLSADWVFERDLPCPQCRYNLRMLHLPRCPECGTVFRWQALLHIGCPRCGQSLRDVDGLECPRCGLALNWERLLGEIDPARFRQYEYSRHPRRAAFAAWLGALRPRRFWANIHLESPPVVHRLRWLRRGAIMFALLAISSAFAVGGRRYLYDCVSVLGIALILPIVTMIALPRFTPTLMRFRIRGDQLLRVTAYGTAGMIWTGILYVSATLPLILVNVTRGGPWQQGLCVNLEQFLGTVLLGYGLWGDPVLACLSTGLGALLLALSFLWWWRFLYVALRSYLRTDASNALALFLSTQAIGTLVLLWWVLNFTVPHSRALVQALGRLERLLH